jgi:Transcriptional regulatory protein, C terminal
MRAIANSQGLQMPAATPKLPPALFIDSKTLFRIMSLNEARQLSQFATVIVLVPLHTAEEGSALSHVVGKHPQSEREASFKVIEFSSKSTTPFIARSTSGDFAFGDVTVNFATMEVIRNDEPVKFTTLEFKTLKYLIQNARRVISREELLNEVWGYHHYPTTRTVDNKIGTLRKRLEKDPSRPVHFQTMHGAGYKFMP